MSAWKQTINSALVRTIGYQLERPKPGSSQPDRNAKTAARLEAVAKRLEKLAAKPAPVAAKPGFPDDFDEELRQIIKAVKPFTMTSPDKLHGLITATRYIARHNIKGDIVECGVWRGGSMHAVARTLDSVGDHSRDLYLFDTYEGMPPPSEKDTRMDGTTAQELLDKGTRSQTIWAYATLGDVKEGFASVPYPAERIHYVEGKVEDTIPDHAPESIALLRLDTDWYESTKHELEHLYSRLVSGGVLIIDDYGYWKGSQQATDEFLKTTGERLLLNRAGTGRIAIKP
jgi:O-methyltransferase